MIKKFLILIIFLSGCTRDIPEPEVEKESDNSALITVYQETRHSIT